MAETDRSVRCRTPVAAVVLRAIAGDGLYDPCDRADPAHAHVPGIGDVQIPNGINYARLGKSEPGIRRRPAVSGEIVRTAAGNSREDPCYDVDASDTMVSAIRDVNVAGRDDKNVGRRIERRVDREPAISRITACAVTGYGGDDARRGPARSPS